MFGRSAPPPPPPPDDDDDGAPPGPEREDGAANDPPNAMFGFVGFACACRAVGRFSLSTFVA
jgi:hypothetical protein